jgi:hypothetical protein
MDHPSSGIVFSIKIHTSNESLSVAEKNLPLRELSTLNNENRLAGRADCLPLYPAFEKNN